MTKTTARPGGKPKMTKEERRAKYTEIARNRRQKDNQRKGGRFPNGNKQTVCYQCREPGHTVANCPSKQDSEESKLLCYKCGSIEHALSGCPKRNVGGLTVNDLPYATCFLCKEKGHLVSACPNNKKGVYPNGGCCRYCGSQQHLATDCKERKKNKKTNKGDGVEESADIEELLEKPREEKPKQSENKIPNAEKKRRVVKF